MSESYKGSSEVRRKSLVLTYTCIFTDFHSYVSYGKKQKKTIETIFKFVIAVTVVM